MSHVKNSRYITPYIPAIIIVTAYGLWLIRPWWKKALVIVLVVIVGLSQLMIFSFGTDDLPEHITVDTPLGELLLFGQKPLGRHQYSVHPIDEDWRLEEVIEDLYIDSERNPTNFTRSHKEIKIGTITRFEDLRFYAALKDYPFEFFTGTAYYEREAFYREFPDFAYITVHNGTLRENSQRVKDFIDENGTGWLSRDFVLLNEYDLPDGTTLQVHKRVFESSDYIIPDPLPTLVL
jgi:hypothetical protein